MESNCPSTFLHPSCPIPGLTREHNLPRLSLLFILTIIIISHVHLIPWTKAQHRPLVTLQDLVPTCIETKHFNYNPCDSQETREEKASAFDFPSVHARPKSRGSYRCLRVASSRRLLQSDPSPSLRPDIIATIPKPPLVLFRPAPGRTERNRLQDAFLSRPPITRHTAGQTS